MNTKLFCLKLSDEAWAISIKEKETSNYYETGKVFGIEPKTYQMLLMKLGGVEKTVEVKEQGKMQVNYLGIFFENEDSCLGAINLLNAFTTEEWMLIKSSFENRSVGEYIQNQKANLLKEIVLEGTPKYYLYKELMKRDNIVILK